jgi:hypothetical protein
MTPGPEAHDQNLEIRVDELRAQLRSLGYLDAGVDRFVLAPARDTRGPVVIAALASVRIGLLAAALLGPAAAVGIGARFPGLVTDTGDAAVVALYLAVLFGLAATAISFVASLIVARLPFAAIAHRARAVSRIAGATVGGACLVYLTLWWRIANPDLAGVSPVWTASVLVIAVAISFLLGHATAITAFAVMAASRPESLPDAVRRNSAWRLTLGAGALAFAAAAALLLIAAPAPAREEPPPNLTVVSPGVRVRLIAIDGFDPAVWAALSAQGRLPALTGALEESAIRILAQPDRDPARDWTTIATGQPPEVHGVHGLETRRVAGLQGSVTSGGQAGIARALRGATDMLRLTRPSTASGAELQAKPLWEVAADAGLRAAVVNWWATWPAMTAGTHPPVILSDRATLRLERGGALHGEIAPAELYERLRADWPTITQEARGLMTTLLPASSDPETMAALRRAAELDALQLVLAARIRSLSPDLTALYLPGLDIVQHALFGSADTAAPSTIEARLDGLRTYYVFLDGLLRDPLQPAADELVILLTQPGRITSIDHGLMAARGAIAASQGAASGRAADVAPTVLHALGVPISRELAGAPLDSIFSGAFLKRFPVREVERYGRRAAPAELRKGQPLDQEMLERLRSLGYVR